MGILCLNMVDIKQKWTKCRFFKNNDKFFFFFSIFSRLVWQSWFFYHSTYLTLLISCCYSFLHFIQKKMTYGTCSYTYKLCYTKGKCESFVAFEKICLQNCHTVSVAIWKISDRKPVMLMLKLFRIVTKITKSSLNLIWKYQLTPAFLLIWNLSEATIPEDNSCLG